MRATTSRHQPACWRGPAHAKGAVGRRASAALVQRLTLAWLFLMVPLTGCFDSLVSSPCDPGYRPSAVGCVASEPALDGGPELICERPLVACEGACLDLSADPDHCGACGRACPSGLCTAGRCEGGLPGHIVAIGHDYRRHHGSMARVLGNAASLTSASEVALARLRGTSLAASSAGTTAALTSSMSALGRRWREVALASAAPLGLEGIDVLLIEAQTGDAAAAQALGAAWAAAIAPFLARGGVVIVLHGAGGVSHRLAQGAGLYTVADPVDSTNVQALVASSSDAVARAVVSPYLAEDSSVVFPGVASPVIATSSGATMVFHWTRL